MTPTLRILACPAAELVGRSVPVGRDGIAIGREAGNDLVLPDDAASRRHARLQPAADGGWEVVDNHSGNGVWVGDQRVTRHRLADGDVIRIGNTRLQLLLPPAPQAMAATVLADPAGATTALCPACNATVTGGSRFCPHCGAAMGRPPAPAAREPRPGASGPPPPMPPAFPVVEAAPQPYGGPPGAGQPLGYPSPGAQPPAYHPPPGHPTPGYPPPYGAPPQGYPPQPYASAPPPGAASPPGYGASPGYPAGHPGAVPRRGPSGCAVGCFVLSLVLFLGTVAGSVYVLHRTGNLKLPGSAALSGAE